MKIIENVYGKSISHYKIGGIIRKIIYPETTKDAIITFKQLLDSINKWTIIGKTSNILISDKGYDGIMVCTTLLDKDVEISDDEIYFPSGMESNKTSEIARRENLTGFEWMSGLPGTIGGAIYMNARCYGSEISDICRKVIYLNHKGDICTIDADKAFRGYKDTVFQQEPCLILGAKFTVHRGYHRSIEEKSLINTEDRISKHQFDYPSCGCFFRNDYASGNSAGKLIDACSLKGFRIGNAQISPHHANFFVNLGDAKASDIINLAKKARNEVKNKFGIDLVPEVCFMGEFDEEI